MIAMYFVYFWSENTQKGIIMSWIKACTILNRSDLALVDSVWGLADARGPQEASETEFPSDKA